MPSNGPVNYADGLYRWQLDDQPSTTKQKATTAPDGGVRMDAATVNALVNSLFKLANPPVFGQPGRPLQSVQPVPVPPQPAPPMPPQGAQPAPMAPPQQAGQPMNILPPGYGYQ